MQSFVSLPLAHGLLLALFLWSGVGNAKPSFVASETSAHPSAHGPHLGVVLMRSGPNVRPLVSPSQGVTLGVGVSNLRGDEDAHSVVLTVKLPSGLALQSASPAPNKAEGSDLVWGLGTIAAHTFPQTFDLNLVVAKDAPPELSVSASVTSSSDREPNLKKNSASLRLVVRPPGADLVAQSTLDAVAVTIGKPIKFGVSVSNEGTISATATRLTALLPQGVSLQLSAPTPSATSGNTLRWQLGDIEPGATRVVIVTVGLDPTLVPSPPGTTTDSKSLLIFKFDASTTANQADPTGNHLEIEKRVERAGADLRVWLDVSGAELPGVLPIGKDVMYTVLYGNFGNAPASGVSVSLNLAPGLNLTRAEPAATRTSQSDKSAGEVFEWDVGDLRVGGSKVINCRVQVNSVPKKGSLVKATISFPGTDIDPSNNIAYSHLYAPRAVSRAQAVLPTKSHALSYFLWMLILVFAFGVLVLVLRRIRRRLRS